MTVATHRLLLVEDSEPLGRQMIAALTDAGYETDWIRDGDQALTAAFDRYGLVILDLMLPGASGFDVLEHLQRRETRIPVLVASARTDSRDKLRALALGAGDYLTKPFWPQELLERVATRLESPGPPSTDVFELGELTIDAGARSVRVGSDPVDLTRAEFDVLATLARRRGAAVSRATLREQAIKEDDDARPQTPDQCVARLKEKLGGSGARIRTVWGIGYALDVG